jgi:hypothetical protein
MLHTEGGAKQNCVAAERRGEAAIASDCMRVYRIARLIFCL